MNEGLRFLSTKTQLLSNSFRVQIVGLNTVCPDALFSGREQVAASDSLKANLGSYGFDLFIVFVRSLEGEFLENPFARF
jgi:hypothetical protein